MSQTESLYDIPDAVYRQLDGEQLALLKLLDDPDDFVFSEVQKAILRHPESMLKVMSMVYDYANVRQEGLLTDRVASVLRMAQVQNIIELLEQPLDWENIIHILVSIDEIVLLRNLEEDFIIEEFESIRKQLWLNTHYYAPKQDIILAIYRTFFNALNFRALEPDAQLADHTFIYAFYNKTTTDVLQTLIFGLIAEMMETPMIPIQVNHTYYLGLPTDSKPPLLKMIVDFPDGNLYMENIAKEYDAATVAQYTIAPNVSGQPELIRRYVASLLEECDDDGLAEALTEIKKALHTSADA